MKNRHIIIVAITIILFGSVMVGIIQALEDQPVRAQIVPALENVRDYAAAAQKDGRAYAVDGGKLHAGNPGAWVEVRTPAKVIVSAVAVDATHDDALYIGAANALALYRSLDAGQSWLHVPLGAEAGGVTDIALDEFQRLVYVGTDTAGLFRLRDVGSSMVVNSQLLLDEPVRQVAADSTGGGLAFARTDSALYRADNYGLRWLTVDNLLSRPTALAAAGTVPAKFYVGTTDRGVLSSSDGLTWTLANDGLNFVAGSRLYIDALAVDPAQPDLVYVATSYLYGSTVVHQTPSRVSFSDRVGQGWTTLDNDLKVAVTELLPVSGYPGAVYALTTESRGPLAFGKAAAPTGLPAPALALVVPAVAASAPLSLVNSPLLPWSVGALAGLALAFAAAYDLTMRRRATPAQTGSGTPAVQPILSKG